jgi:polygalacturonase
MTLRWTQCAALTVLVSIWSAKGAGLRVFNVRDFGATGDGKSMDTVQVQWTFDQCAKSGGLVRIPAGTYLITPITLHSGITVELEAGAILQATDDPKDFEDPQRRGAVRSLITGRNLTNVVIKGHGIVDGAGARWWGPIREAKRAGQPDPFPRPRLISLDHCQHVRVEGITLRNSPSFHLVPSDCEDVEITGVTIRAPADSPNTDAIDPAASRNVRITRCTLDVGDDNVAIKSGHADPAHPGAAAEDIEVRDCTMLHGHGMSIGSETLGGVRHVVVENCTFKDTVSGLRIKSSRERGGLVEDIVYRNITMTNVRSPILITAYYPKIPTNDVAQAVTRTTPMYRDIRIENLTGSSPESAGTIVGLPECVVSNVVLENVTLTAPAGLTIRNAKGIELKNTKIEVQHGEPVREENAEVRKTE